MIKVEERKIISVQDWDSLVEEVYGRPYSLQQQDGCKDRGLEHLYVSDNPYDFEEVSIPYGINGSDMGVSFESWLNTEPDSFPYVNSWEKTIWYSRYFYPSSEAIAADLLKRGLIEEGEYWIDIDW